MAGENPKPEDVTKLPPGAPGDKPAGTGTTVNQVANAVDQMAAISVQIRKAISAALPGPPDQNLTIMVPGKVVNFGESHFCTL